MGWEILNDGRLFSGYFYDYDDNNITTITNFWFFLNEELRSKIGSGGLSFWILFLEDLRLLARY